MNNQLSHHKFLSLWFYLRKSWQWFCAHFILQKESGIINSLRTCSVYFWREQTSSQILFNLFLHMHFVIVTWQKLQEIIGKLSYNDVMLLCPEALLSHLNAGLVVRSSKLPVTNFNLQDQGGMSVWTEDLPVIWKGTAIKGNSYLCNCGWCLPYSTLNCFHLNSLLIHGKNEFTWEFLQ